jgi:hypothetical protein
MNDFADDVEDRVRALGEVRVTAGAHDATQALAAMFEDPEVRASVEATRGRRFSGFSRRHRIVVGSLIALAGMSVTVPAVAITSLLARTGEFGSGTGEADDTEWIALGADDAPQVVVEAYPDYLTLPDGMPREVAIAAVSRIFERMTAGAGGHSLAQEGLMTQTYETFAMCAWTDEWLTAHESSNETDEAVATAWLGDFDNLRAFLAADGGGIREYLTSVAVAAENGDVGAMEHTYDESGCESQLSGEK